MDCNCGGTCKPLDRVGPTPETHWAIDQCRACGREHRRLVSYPVPVAAGPTRGFKPRAIEKEAKVATKRRKLSRPSRYQANNRQLFRTAAALRKHLDRRRDNGLLEYGAVVESRLGLLIDEERFATWLISKSAQD